jgi:hypothetical protein
MTERWKLRQTFYRLADEHARVVLDAARTHRRTAHTAIVGQSRVRRRPSVA